MWQIFSCEQVADIFLQADSSYLLEGRQQISSYGASSRYLFAGRQQISF
jgi:hypothetical protein